MKKILRILCLVLCLMLPAYAAVELIGAGASFPYPLYARMFDIYSKESGVKVNYQAVGSAGGIRQIKAQTIDFGATDSFLTKEEMKSFPGDILHIPTCVGAVGLIYNVPNIPRPLQLTPEVLVDIFFGKIKMWDDDRIVQLNQGVRLPNLHISVIYRSDGSGTAAILTDYFSKVSTAWRDKVGNGRKIKWPVGIGSQKNAGVAGLVKQLPGSIGFVDLIYALSNKIPVAAIKNASGVFVLPTVRSTMYAADIHIPVDTRASITNSKHKNGYPIVGFTWLLVYQQQKYQDRTKEQAQALVKLLDWVIHDGQKYAEDMYYARLPQPVAKNAVRLIASMQYGAEKLK